MIKLKHVCRNLGTGGSRFGMVLLAAIVLALFLGMSSASADVQPFEVDAYQQGLDIPPAVAKEDLEVQAKGSEVDIAGELENKLGKDFAGIWFDPAYGDYVVPVASDTAGALAGEVMANAQLANNYRTRAVKYSWAELKSAHEEIDLNLRELFDANLIYTSLDPRTNAVVVHVASAIDAIRQAKLNQIAQGVGGEVELRPSKDALFQGTRDACSNLVPNCSSPLRGGVEIGPWKQPNGGTCTAAFRAIGTNGQKYLLSAGHCAAEKNPSNPLMNWQARDEQKLPVYGQAKYLGKVEQLAFPAHDWMKINVTGSEWDIPLQSWPSLVAYWGKGSGVAGQPPIDPEYAINGEASSIVGQGVCHSGIASGSSCGQVSETNVSFNFGEKGNLTYDLVKVKNACSEGGDSGGPWFASNIAYGIHIGKAAPLEACGSSTFYEEITDATEALGVTVGPVFPPQVETKSATAIGSSQATLNGTVSPRGLPTTYRFEYGTSTAYGNSVPVPDGSAGSGPNAISESVTAAGLQSNTRYHFRVVATSVAGTSYGVDRTFTTSANAHPAVIIDPFNGLAALWRGSDGNLYETVAPGGKSWTTFSPTWGALGGVKVTGNPAVAIDPSNGLAAMWRGSDGNLYETVAPGGKSWTTFSPTWGALAGGIEVAGNPAVAIDPSNGLAAMWRGSDGNLYETVAPGGKSWTTFSPTWGALTGGVTVASDPAVVIDPANGLAALWRGSDGNLYETVAPGGKSWTTFSPTWGALGGVKVTGDPAVVIDPANGLAALWRGSDGNLYETVAPGGKSWTTFSPTWGALTGGVTVAGE